MATVFDIIKKEGGSPDKSLAWYRKKINQISNKISAAGLMRSGKLYSTPQTNGLNFFRYNPKWKEILPYYDLFPLVLPIQPAPGGFLGVNFHYLPIQLRMRLFETLADKNFKGDYRALKNVKEIKPTLKHYLRSQLASKFLRLEEDEFAPAIFMTVQQFRKAGASTVWSKSRRMI